MAYNPADLRLPTWLLALLAIWVRISLPFWPGWRISMSRPGVMFFSIFTGVWAAAFYSGNNLLYLCGSVLLVMALAAVIESIRLLHFVASLDLPLPDCGEVGQSLLIRRVLEGRHDFSAMVEMHRDGGGGSVDFDLRLEGGRVQLTGRLPALQRGLYCYAKTRLATTAPLGLWRLEWCRDAHTWELMILPESLAWSLSADSKGEEQGYVISAGDELYGLRPYVRGDAVSRVHWRKSLTDQWSVKLFATATEPQAVIKLLRVDLRAEPGEKFEQLLARCRFWIENGCKQKESIDMVIGQQTFERVSSKEGQGGSRHEALRALAMAMPEVLPPVGSGGIVLDHHS
ncbi:MAG: DUF58 domain-containing protein [Mariprofundaceae bacterium]